MRCIYWPRKPLLLKIAVAVWRVIREHLVETMIIH